jgi:hypothetical protein
MNLNRIPYVPLLHLCSATSIAIIKGPAVSGARLIVRRPLCPLEPLISAFLLPLSVLAATLFDLVQDSQLQQESSM